MRISGKIYRGCLSFLYHIFKYIPGLKVIYFTRNTQSPVRLSHIVLQKVLKINSSAYWPVHFTSQVKGGQNVYCGIDVSPGIMPGCYIQALNKIYIDDYTQIGPNVGLISANHNIYNTTEHVFGKEIFIGKYCWIGMNAVILPGVKLGDFTIVAAGSVVSRSFKNGYCVVGGNPAQKLYSLDKTKCISYKNIYEYNGFVEHNKFLKNINKYFKK